jgi:hypothetical protein
MLTDEKTILSWERKKREKERQLRKLEINREVKRSNNLKTCHFFNKTDTKLNEGTPRFDPSVEWYSWIKDGASSSR